MSAAVQPAVTWLVSWQAQTIARGTKDWRNVDAGEVPFATEDAAEADRAARERQGYQGVVVWTLQEVG